MSRCRYRPSPASHDPGSRSGSLPAARRCRTRNDHGRDRRRRRAHARHPGRADGRRRCDWVCDPRPFQPAPAPQRSHMPHARAPRVIARRICAGQSAIHLREVARRRSRGPPARGQRCGARFIDRTGTGRHLALAGNPPRMDVTVSDTKTPMGMAHGYYRIAGKPAAVMVHVTVGTANAINGLINAARDNIPVLLAAGRTPLTETGSIASRNRPIHWGQEAFDQGGMLREYVKWDYELRSGQPVEAVVDRALDIAMSEPRGPVYLTLPREVLSAPGVKSRRNTVRPLGSMAPEPARVARSEERRVGK